MPVLPFVDGRPTPISRPTFQPLGPFGRITTALDRIDRRRAAVIALAAVLTVVTGRTVLESRAIVAGFGSVESVAIATRDLAPGTVVDADAVRWEQWPSAVAPDTVTDLDIGSEATIVRSPIAGGEPVMASRVFVNGAGLALDERAVTIPQPLAPPPVEPGDVLDLIGLTPGITIGEKTVLDSRSLGRGRVVTVDETGITIAVPADRVAAIVETIAIGSVEVAITPFDP